MALAISVYHKKRSHFVHLQILQILIQTELAWDLKPGRKYIEIDGDKFFWLLKVLIHPVYLKILKILIQTNSCISFLQTFTVQTIASVFSSYLQHKPLAFRFSLLSVLFCLIKKVPKKSRSL
jgi:hypothetical protein